MSRKYVDIPHDAVILHLDKLGFCSLVEKQKEVFDS